MVLEPEEGVADSMIQVIVSWTSAAVFLCGAVMAAWRLIVRLRENPQQPLEAVEEFRLALIRQAHNLRHRVRR